MTTQRDGDKIWIEFYGVARQRTGTATVCVPVAQSVSLEGLWRQLVARFPELEVSDDVKHGAISIYRINLDGDRFITDPLTQIRSGQSVLIMSADAGG